MSRLCHLITHGEVAIDSAVLVPDWPLSEKGRARHEAFSATPLAARVTAIYSSGERKALDGAEILAAVVGVAPIVVEALHENDRSATGFLPREEFERTADAFFAEPEVSVRGWERAVDAQARMVGAMDGILARDGTDGDIAVIAHGGVGALYLSHLAGRPISRADDQPGAGGGNLYTFDIASRRLVAGWRPLEVA